jgi:hypothetical protein
MPLIFIFNFFVTASSVPLVNILTFFLEKRGWTSWPLHKNNAHNLFIILVNKMYEYNNQPKPTFLVVNVATHASLVGRWPWLGHMPQPGICLGIFVSFGRGISFGIICWLSFLCSIYLSVEPYFLCGLLDMIIYYGETWYYIVMVKTMVMEISYLSTSLYISSYYVSPLCKFVYLCFSYILHMLLVCKI